MSLTTNPNVTNATSGHEVDDKGFLKSVVEVEVNIPIDCCDPNFDQAARDRLDADVVEHRSLHPDIDIIRMKYVP